MLALADLVRLGPAGTGPIVELLEDECPEVRSVAVQALGVIGEVSLGPVLEGVVATDPSAEARIYAIGALGMLDLAKSSSAVRRAMDRDDVFNVRRKAEQALLTPDPQPVEEVRQALLAFTAETLDSAAIDRPAPPFRLKDTRGRTYSLDEYRGKSAVVLVFLVGDICPYDPAQIGRLRRAKAKFEELGSTLLMVESHETCRLDTTLKNSAPNPGDPEIPLLSDPSSTVSASYGVAMQGRGHTEWSNRPASVIIDRDGKIRFIHRDPFDSRLDPEVLLQIVRLLNTEGQRARG